MRRRIRNRAVIKVPKKPSPYSRVTTVLDFVNSSWKEFWFKSIGFEEAERFGRETREFGTAVHKIIENYLLDKPNEGEFTERQKECANYVIQWLKETKAELVRIGGMPTVEFECVDDDLKLIGHFDALVKIGETLWIIDYKTSSKMKREFPLQKAAYAKMLEKYKLDVNDGVTIRIDRDPQAKKQFELAEYHDLKGKYWPLFKKALELYQYFTGKKKI